MLVWLGLFIALLVLAVLGIADGYALSAVADLDAAARIERLAQLDLLLLYGGLTALIIIAGGWLVLRRLSLRNWLKRAIQAALILGVLILFTLRTLISVQHHEALSPDARILVSATAEVRTLSDSVYDPVLGSGLRQVALLSDVKPYTAGTHHSFIVNNPLFEQHDATDSATAASATDDTSLDYLNGITVLMSANPEFIKADELPSFSALQSLKPGQKIQADLLITPINKQTSAAGFNAAIWLGSRHIHANANIVSISGTTDIPPTPAVYLQSLRQVLRDVFYKGSFGQDWHSLSGDKQQAAAVTLALLSGDRALIDRQTKDLYQLAGISHLLAISGTHVLFLALLLAGFISRISDKLTPMIYQTVPRWQLRMAVMVIASLLYALFTGFDVPAMRTVYMLIAMWCVRAWALPLGQVSALVLVGLVMVWLDPMVLWQAGFWLSFIAVLLLIRYEGGDLQVVVQKAAHGTVVSADMRAHGRLFYLRQQLQHTAKLQLWLFILMLPLSLLLFTKVSVWGLIVNLFAINLFGMIIVPLNLLGGVLYLLSPTLAALLWQLSALILVKLHSGLALILSSAADSAWLYAPFGMAGFILSLIIAALLLLPNVLPRYVLLIPMVALIFMAKPITKAGLMVEKLASDSKNIRYTLLSQHSGSEEALWLIMADDGQAKLSPHELDTLTDNLHKKGIKRLDGVIVQTADDGLQLLVQELSTRLPISHYWQAGRVAQGQALRSIACTANLTWAGAGLQIRALTGWADIDDVAVQDCALEVISDAGAHFTDLKAVDADSDDEKLDETDNHHADNNQPVQLVINANQSARAWELWVLLCESDNYLQMATDNKYQRYWLDVGQVTVPDTLKVSFYAKQMRHSELPER